MGADLDFSQAFLAFQAAVIVVKPSVAGHNVGRHRVDVDGLARFVVVIGRERLVADVGADDFVQLLRCHFELQLLQLVNQRCFFNV